MHIIIITTMNICGPLSNPNIFPSSSLIIHWANSPSLLICNAWSPSFTTGSKQNPSVLKLVEMNYSQPWLYMILFQFLGFQTQSMYLLEYWWYVTLLKRLIIKLMILIYHKQWLKLSEIQMIHQHPIQFHHYKVNEAELAISVQQTCLISYWHYIELSHPLWLSQWLLVAV